MGITYKCLVGSFVNRLVERTRVSGVLVLALELCMGFAGVVTTAVVCLFLSLSNLLVLAGVDVTMLLTGTEDCT
jgi:hypothetical protein